MGEKRCQPLGTTGFGLLFLLPIGFFSYPFLTHSHLKTPVFWGLFGFSMGKSLFFGWYLMFLRPFWVGKLNGPKEVLKVIGGVSCSGVELVCGKLY